MVCDTCGTLAGQVSEIKDVVLQLASRYDRQEAYIQTLANHVDDSKALNERVEAALFRVLSRVDASAHELLVPKVKRARIPPTAVAGMMVREDVTDSSIHMPALNGFSNDNNNNTSDIATKQQIPFNNPHAVDSPHSAPMNLSVSSSPVQTGRNSANAMSGSRSRKQAAPRRTDAAAVLDSKDQNENDEVYTYNDESLNSPPTTSPDQSNVMHNTASPPDHDDTRLPTLANSDHQQNNMAIANLTSIYGNSANQLGLNMFPPGLMFSQPSLLTAAAQAMTSPLRDTLPSNPQNTHMSGGGTDSVLAMLGLSSAGAATTMTETGGSPTPRRNRVAAATRSTRGGEKGAFECDQCHAKFMWRGTWKRHMATVHSKIRYKCTRCGFTSSRKDYLYVHIRTNACSKRKIGGDVGQPNFGRGRPPKLFPGAAGLNLTSPFNLSGLNNFAPQFDSSNVKHEDDDDAPATIAEEKIPDGEILNFADDSMQSEDGEESEGVVMNGAGASEAVPVA